MGLGWQFLWTPSALGECGFRVDVENVFCASCMLFSPPLPLYHDCGKNITLKPGTGLQRPCPQVISYLAKGMKAAELGWSVETSPESLQGSLS